MLSTPVSTTRLAFTVSLALASWGTACSPVLAEESTAERTTEAASLQTVEINGRRLSPPPSTGPLARRGRLGVLGDTDVMDAPFSVTNYTAQAIRDQQATTVAEVVGQDASVRIAAQPGGILDAFYIRGFPVNEGNLGEFALDGVFGAAPNYRVLSDYAERVELIKGPTALLYGMAPNSGVGGSVNIVPKRASDADLTHLTAEFASRSQLAGSVDLGRRFGPAREFGLRVNGSARDGDTPLDKQSRSARVGAAALDYRGERLKATLDLVDQHERFDAPSRPFLVAAGIAVPAAPEGRLNVTQPWEWAKINDQSALLRTEYDLGSGLVVFVHAGGAHTRVDRLSGTPTILDAAGNVQWTTQRYQLDIRRSTSEAGLRARLDTGSIRHALTLQATQYRDRLSRGFVNGTAVRSNLYTPVDSAEQVVATPASLAKISQTELTGVALADTLELFDRRVLVTLGLRSQQVKSDNFNASTGAVSLPRYDQRATTPLVGVVVQPRQGLSVYGNYIEGLSKGDTAPATASNSGEVLSPYKARQYELGVKIEHGRLATTASAFQITKPNGQLTGTVFAADAQQRNRGVELNLFGEAAPAVRLQGGITLLDAKLTKSSTAARVGKTPIGVPELQANLGVEWDAGPPGLTLTGAAFHTGKQYVDAVNTQSIPAWNRIDAGARYRTVIAGKSTTLRLNVRNLLDRDYWAGVASYGGLAQGGPRALQVSAEVNL